MSNLRSSPKDVFLHLLSIIALYISAGGLVALLFQYVNIFFPDPLNHYYYPSVAGSIRWSMASLIIVFPVYLLVSWLLQNDYREAPEKRELKIRKWLVHFTLFVAAIIIIGDLVTLVYNFLGGELTIRFILKVLAVLLVSGAIFSYYLWDLRKRLTSKQLWVWGSAVSALVFLSVVGGFFTAGSPLKARLYRFDEQRVNDLQVLQSEIVNYWIQKNKLPADLADLKNDITGFRPPVDPESAAPYSYSVSEPLTFELCASFSVGLPGQGGESAYGGNFPVAPELYRGSYQENWTHGQGKTCFERKIDPELYPHTIKPTRLQ